MPVFRNTTGTLEIEPIERNFTPLGAFRMREDILGNLTRNYILLGLVWLVAGMIFGAWLGATNHMNYANSHAHMNLLGFVVSVLFGLIHWATPNLSKSRLANPQFLIYEIGAVTLVFGKIMVDANGAENPALIVGSVITIIGAALMLVIFAKHAAS